MTAGERQMKAAALPALTFVVQAAVGIIAQ
jgi:hypothetical protein